MLAYRLSIKPLSGPADACLSFQTTVDSVHDAAGEGRGMLVQYRPAPDSPETARLLQVARKEIATAIPKAPDFAPADLAARRDAVLTESEPTGVSPLTRAALEESPVKLFLDQSEESRQALALFSAARQQFQPLVAAPADAGAPWVEFGDERYRGLTHVRQVVEALGRFNTSFRAGVERLMPGEQEPGGVAVQRWLETRRLQALAAGEDIVEGRRHVH